MVHQIKLGCRLRGSDGSKTISNLSGNQKKKASSGNAGDIAEGTNVLDRGSKSSNESYRQPVLMDVKTAF